MPAQTYEARPNMALELNCPECDRLFNRGHHRQSFCCTEHQVAYNNRILQRGQAMLPLVMTWRGTRSARDPSLKRAGKQAFADLCRLADEYNAEDRAEGRPAIALLVVRRRALGQGLLGR